MIVNFNNLNVTEQEFTEEVLEAIRYKLNEVVHHTVKEVENEADVDIKNTYIKDVKLNCGFEVEGEEELLVLTVEHHEGYDETLTWNVDLDKSEADNNKDESNYSEFEVAIMNGKDNPKEFKTIASVYSDSELDKVDEVAFKGMKRVEYVTKEGVPEKVYRYYQDGRLIQETFQELGKEKAED